MAALTGNTIASTYKDLLQVSNSNSGVDGTLRNVEDGEGTASALQISSSAVNINGGLTASGDVNFDSNTLFVDASENAVGIGTQYPIRPLSVGYGAAKTSTSTAYAMSIQSNESSGQAALQFYAVGGASAAARKWQLQTTEVGVSNSGEIELQPDGGKVTSKGIYFTGNFLDGNDTGISSSGDGGDLRIYTNGTNSTIFASNGNVGIHTSPAASTELHVAGQRMMLSHTGQVTYEMQTNDTAAIFQRVHNSTSSSDINGAIFMAGNDASNTVSFHVNYGGGDSGNNYNRKLHLNANSVISLSNNDSGSSNTLFGDSCGDSIDAGSNFNVFIGKSVATGSTDDASDNVAIGFESMKAIIQGDDNVALGMRTLLDLEDGSNNTAIGDSVLRACVDASDNTAVGAYAMDATTTGNNNVAMGKNALGNTADVDRCVAIGSAALSQSNITSNADGAIGVGYFALGNLTTGAYNLAIGYQAMMGHTTGHSNIAIGRDAMGDTDAGSTCSDSDDNIAIGYQCMGGAWNNAAKSEYNVAMGNYALDAQLNGANANTCIGYSSGSAIIGGSNSVLLGFHAGSSISSGSNNVMIGYQAGTDTVALTTGDNNICIGYNTRTSANSNTNSIVIGQSIDSASNQVSIGKAGNKIYNEFDTDNAWTQSSDVRLKKDIQDSTLGLDFVNDLRPVTYQWKSSNELPKDFAHYNEENNKTTGVTMTGLIAQEVKEAIDKSGVERFAGWAEDRDGVQQISKEMFVFPLIKAVQELTAKVEELETKLNNKES